MSKKGGSVCPGQVGSICFAELGSIWTGQMGSVWAEFPINNSKETQSNHNSLSFNDSIEYTKNLDSLNEFLSRNSESYEKIIKNFSVSTDEIRARIKNTEAIIEYGKFAFIYNDNTYSDFYFALLLSNSEKEIICFPLGFEREIKNNNPQKRIEINQVYSDGNLYDFFIEPITGYLKDKKRVYVSTAGILSRFNLASFLSKNDESIIDKIDFRYFTSYDSPFSADDQFNYITNVSKVALFGGIDYGNMGMRGNSGFYSTRSGINEWGYLPETLKEVDFIDSIVRLRKISTSKYTGKNASEKKFYEICNIKNPFIFHIATHGFVLYNKSLDIYSNPLDFCGLLFSDANKYWKNIGRNIQDSSDGILFGSELANLNLENCILAVLSACETGRGKIINNEGVFSLSRSLKLAGVNNCIVTLWEIPDKQTAEFFKEFYLQLSQGKSIHNAFYDSQKTLRKRYLEPYYWAGFTLIE